MNARDFELLYYVVIHGSIGKAARLMPDPAERQTRSEQLDRFEKEYGVPLWDRDRRCCTPAGQEVFERIRPCFEWMDSVRRRGASATTPAPIRIAASDLILSKYLPALLREARRRRPGLRFAPIAPAEPDMRARLQRCEVHVIIGSRDLVPPNAESIPLTQRQLVLLVPASAPWKSAAQLLALPAKKRPPLICPGLDSVVGRLCRDGLARLGKEWPPEISTHSTAAVDPHVLDGGGVGVSVDIAPLRRPRLRALPLAGFGMVDIVAAWPRTLTAALEPLPELIRERARKL